MADDEKVLVPDASKTKEDFYFIDYLKAIAILFIIITHSGLARHNLQNIFIVYFVNFAVPLLMIITGFNYTLSLKRRDNTVWYSLYNWRILLKRFLKLTIPLWVIIIIEYALNTLNIQEHRFTTSWINGGAGPGAYYYPVMLQVFVLFPLIYLIINKYKEKGLIIIFLLNLLWEYISVRMGLKADVYRILAFRYIFFMALGSYIMANPKKISPLSLLTSFVIGLNLLTIFMYNESKVYYPFTNWTSTSFLFAFYIFPIFAYVYYNWKDYKLNNIFGNLMRTMGKASWHIFLVQMFYYGQFMKYNLNHPTLINLIINIILCTIGGIFFYKAEMKIRSVIGKFSAKNI